jgi:predicted secreted protein
MNIGLAVAIYFLLWWLVLFAVLPWGVRRQDEQEEDGQDEVVPGSDPGAPARPLLLKKAVATTLISAAIFAAGFAVWKTGMVALDRLPMPFEVRGY